MRIIGPPSATDEQVQAQLRSMNIHARFSNEMFEHLWFEAGRLGIDPVGMIAQSYKETGGGHFRGNVRPEFYNTSGIKVRHVGKFPGVDDGDLPLAHAQFPNWRVGAMAQAQHLRAYAGWPLDEYELIVDPRYHLVKGKWIENWSQLGGVGSWAPSTSYGQEIESIMARLRS
jgi:Mannosyl-glycoprotein endo-beta-N-acetylglucosaminidase